MTELTLPAPVAVAAPPALETCGWNGQRKYPNQEAALAAAATPLDAWWCDDGCGAWHAEGLPTARYPSHHSHDEQENPARDRNHR